MRRRGSGSGTILAFAVAAAVFLPAWRAPAAASGDGFSVHVDGRILRKASGKLIFSLSRFELGGAREVRMRNRKTGEARTVAISSAYDDLCYSDPLPDEVIDSIDIADWLPYVEWTVPDTLEGLNRRLSEVHEEQNRLRRELGSALLEGGDPAVKVSSRITLNKIEKFHRVGTRIAREILRLNGGNLDVNPFLFPVRVEVGFNPFGNPSSASKDDLPGLVKEVMFWEVHRILTQQFGVQEGVVDFVYDSPATVRRIVAPPGTDASEAAGFVPAVTLSPVAVDTAVYLTRQGTGEEVQKYVRLKMYKDRFLTDRVLLDAFVNEGSVAFVSGSEAAVTFVPPFVKVGEVLFVDPGDGAGKEIPIVVAAIREPEGVSMSAPLPEEEISRIRPGMVVRRR